MLKKKHNGHTSVPASRDHWRGVDTHRSRLCQVGRVDLGYGSGHHALLLYAITNDDNLGYGLLVLEKGDTHVGRAFLFLEL